MGGMAVVEGKNFDDLGDNVFVVYWLLVNALSRRGWMIGF